MNSRIKQKEARRREREREKGRERRLTREPKKSPLQEAHLSTLCVCVWEREDRVWMLLSKTIKLHVTPRREKRLNLSIRRRRMENGERRRNQLKNDTLEMETKSRKKQSSLAYNNNTKNN